jgi:hypothetical protein
MSNDNDPVGIIPQQFNEGYRHGQADARVNERYTSCRYMFVNNLNHKHEDFIMGFCKGFYDQKLKMFVEGDVMKEN